MSDIHWPQGYLPGTTDNYVCNAVIVPELTAQAVWPFLSHPAAWPKYYANASDIVRYGQTDPELELGSRFRFTTFGFLVEAEVTEYEPPMNDKPGRIAWHGWVEGGPDERLDVIHAWIVENLSGNRVRILTEETQIGAPAQAMAKQKPNPMLNAHQDWLDGLVQIARKQSIPC